MNTNLKDFFRNFFIYDNTKEIHTFTLPENDDDVGAAANSRPGAYANHDVCANQGTCGQVPLQTIFPTLSINLEHMKNIYNSSINSDIVVREFTLNANNKEFSAFMIYIEGMIDTILANDVILKSLMLKNFANTANSDVVKIAISNNISVKKTKKFDLENQVINSLLPHANVTSKNSFQELTNDINSGNCILFVDTLSSAFSIDVKGFPTRGITEPQTEIVINGSKEAFVESLRTNTTILRRLVNNENLTIESTSVGKISKTNCVFAYIKSIANDSLVNEVKFRLSNLNIDYLVSSGQLEQMVEDKSNTSLPQIISTERPDRATSYLLEGRVVLFVNGSPYALIVPATFTDFLASSEDVNLKYQYANMLKLIRLIAYFIALLLPGIYIAITNYHHELLPTELLFSIAAAREAVPFPVIVEIFMMEFSFELIREASLRSPASIGSTLGIIGSLILGQAAVSAHIVSPILIIIVAITRYFFFCNTQFFFCI